MATPTNLEDLYQVYHYCKKNGFRFAVCPELQGVKPNSQLKDNQEYQELFNYLISEKKAGELVNGGIQYLEYMRDIKKFSCRPSTVLAISPTADVFYPCLEIGHVAGNLLQTPNLHQIRRKGREQFGPEPRCDNRCQSACALGLSTILNNPSTLVSDAYLATKSEIKKRLG